MNNFLNYLNQIFVSRETFTQLTNKPNATLLLCNNKILHFNILSNIFYTTKPPLPPHYK